ncbi:MAG: PqqD family protein [Acidimicrobiia bacterium]|nr:PqqD family protein [Acidimicrobiia bacterium]
MQTTLTYQRAPGTVHEVSDGCAVVLDPTGTTMTTLNSIGTIVWEALAEPRDVDELLGLLAAAHPDTPPAVLEHDIAEFLSDLESKRLVSAADAGS